MITWYFSLSKNILLLSFIVCDQERNIELIYYVIENLYNGGNHKIEADWSKPYCITIYLNAYDLVSYVRN